MSAYEDLHVSGPEPEPETFAPPPAPPCDVYLKSGAVFAVKELDSWQWHEAGLFGTGRFTTGSNGASGEQDVLFPFASLSYIVYHFPTDE